MNENTFRLFKLIIGGTICSTLLGLYVVDKTNNVSDTEIIQSSAEYCLISNQLKTAHKSYDECIKSVINKIDFDSEYIKECRRNSYDINGITDYRTNTVELMPSFIKEYRALYKIAKTPLSNGKQNYIHCDVSPVQPIKSSQGILK